MSNDKIKIITDKPIIVNDRMKSEVQPIKHEKVEQRPKPVKPPAKKN